jgi:hypothetical protein
MDRPFREGGDERSDTLFVDGVAILFRLGHGMLAGGWG